MESRFAHQARALALSKDEPGFAHFMDKGTGKTRVLIEDLSEPDRLPAVATVKPAVLSHWARETRRWAKKIRTAVVADKPLFGLPKGTLQVRNSEDRKKILEDPSEYGVDLIIISFDTLKGIDRNDLRPCLKTLICDESTLLRNPQSGRTQACRFLARFARWIRIASGYPAPEGLADLWCQYDLIVPGLLGPTLPAFHKRWFKPVDRAWGCEWVPGMGATDEILAEVKPFTFSIRFEECMDLPPKLYEVRTVEPSPFTKKLIAEVTETKKLAGMDLKDPMARVTKLLQIPNGFYYDSDGRAVFHEDNSKAAAIADVLRELPSDHRVVVWSPYRAHIPILVAGVWKQKTGRALFRADGDQDVDAWKKTPGGVLFTTMWLHAGANLAEGVGPSCTAIYAARSLKTEENVQSEDRQYRPPQTKSVRIIDIVSNTFHGTFYHELVQRKIELADAIVEGFGDPKEESEYAELLQV